MNNILLLGAGFSRNWGGWLASEAFEYLLGCKEIINNSHVRKLLWRHKDNGGFEAALALIQQQWKINPQKNLPHLIALQDSIQQMFFDMNTAFLELNNLEFQPMQEKMLRTTMASFDAIFTLNQDLLLEHLYLNDNVSLASQGIWSGFQLPGLTPQPSKQFKNVNSTANKDWLPIDPADFQVQSKMQPYFKLHGSCNWRYPTGSPLLVMGGNKEGEIYTHPILSWYQQKFDEYLAKADARLLVIGYGFRDVHINSAIEKAVDEHGLKIFIIDPFGADLAWKLNETRTKGAIPAGSSLEELFKKSIIGASRRSLKETFGDDSVEHSKVMRFIEG